VSWLGVSPFIRFPTVGKEKILRNRLQPSHITAVCTKDSLVPDTVRRNQGSNCTDVRMSAAGQQV